MRLRLSSEPNESLALMREGRTLTEVGITLLTGGEPLKVEKPEDTVIEFITPIIPPLPVAEVTPEGLASGQETGEKPGEGKKK